MVSDDVLAFVRAALPPPPARVLEVGAGSGELAEALAAAGHELVAIDPEPRGPAVRRAALLEVEEPVASFDAAVAVLSLHHVEPLTDSCRLLGELVRPGGRLVIDEFDVARFDDRAAAWWIAQRREAGGEAHVHAADMTAELRAELHSLDDIREALAPWFESGEPVPGPYLHRWDLDPALRTVEEAAIAAGELPATGARLVATRR